MTDFRLNTVVETLYTNIEVIILTNIERYWKQKSITNHNGESMVSSRFWYTGWSSKGDITHRYTLPETFFSKQNFKHHPSQIQSNSERWKCSGNIHRKRNKRCGKAEIQKFKPWNKINSPHKKKTRQWENIKPYIIQENNFVEDVTSADFYEESLNI